MGGHQFHLSSLPHKREHETTNGIPGVTPLPDSIFTGVGMPRLRGPGFPCLSKWIGERLGLPPKKGVNNLEVCCLSHKPRPKRFSQEAMGKKGLCAHVTFGGTFIHGQQHFQNSNKQQNASFPKSVICLRVCMHIFCVGSKEHQKERKPTVLGLPEKMK